MNELNAADRAYVNDVLRQVSEVGRDPDAAMRVIDGAEAARPELGEAIRDALLDLGLQNAWRQGDAESVGRVLAVMQKYDPPPVA